MMTIGTPLMWTLFGLFVLVALALDFYALNRQVALWVSMCEAAIPPRGKGGSAYPFPPKKTVTEERRS